jgi:hypothetical protein
MADAFRQLQEYVDGLDRQGINARQGDNDLKPMGRLNPANGQVVTIFHAHQWGNNGRNYASPDPDIEADGLIFYSAFKFKRENERSKQFERAIEGLLDAARSIEGDLHDLADLAGGVAQLSVRNCVFLARAVSVNDTPDPMIEQFNQLSRNVIMQTYGGALSVPFAATGVGLLGSSSAQGAAAGSRFAPGVISHAVEPLRRGFGLAA